MKVNNWKQIAIVMMAVCGFFALSTKVPVQNAQAQGEVEQVLYFPRIAKAQTPYPLIEYLNLADYEVGLGLTNSGNTTAEVTLTAVAENGLILLGFGITNPAKLSLPAGAQIARYAWQLFGQGIIGKKAYVEVRSRGGKLHGLYENFDQKFNWISGGPALLPSDASTRLLFPLAKRIFTSRFNGQPGVDERTEFDLINPNEVQATVTIRYWNTYFEGDHVPAVTQVSIPPRGKVQESIEGLPSFFGTFNNYVEIVPDVPILVAGLYFYNNWDSKTLPVLTSTTRTAVALNAIPATKAIREANVRVVDTHLTTLTGWYTNLVLWNIGQRWTIGATGRSIFLDFWDERGNSLGSEIKWVRVGELTQLYAKDLVGGGVNGSSSYYIDRPLTGTSEGILMLERFGDTAEGIAGEYRADNFIALVPPIDPVIETVLAHVAVGEFAPDREFGSGIAVRDARTESNNPAKNRVTLELWSGNGNLLHTTVRELGPQAKFAETLDQIFPSMAIPQFSGHVRVSSSMPVKTFGMYWVSDLVLGRVTALSVVPAQ